MKSIFFALSLSLVLLSGSEVASAQKPTLPATAMSTFSCDTPAGHVCFFSISNSAGVMTLGLTIPGGDHAQVLLPANDAQSYVVTVDKNLTQDWTCQAAVRAGAFCKRARVARGFNN